jgi:hypothetical protein
MLGAGEHMKLLYLFFIIVGLIAFAGIILIIYEATKKLD